MRNVLVFAALISAPLVTSSCTEGRSDAHAPSASHKAEDHARATRDPAKANTSLTALDHKDILKYSYSFVTQPLAEGGPASFFFTDYPVTEDAAASSAGRTKAYAKAVRAFEQKEGRAPNEWERGLLDQGTGGYYLAHRQAELPGGVKGLFVAANNRSYDIDSNVVFTLGDSRTLSLEPNKTYEVSGKIEFYSNTPVGGESDAVQIGFSASNQPWGRVENKGYWRTTRGGQINTNPFGERDYVYLGNMTNGFKPKDKGAQSFVLNAADNENQPITVRTGADHFIHVNFRTHSSFGGLSSWVIKSVELSVEPVNEMIATTAR